MLHSGLVCRNCDWRWCVRSPPQTSTGLPTHVLFEHLHQLLHPVKCCRLWAGMTICRVRRSWTRGAGGVRFTLSSRSQGSKVRYVASSSAATCRQIQPLSLTTAVLHVNTSYAQVVTAAALYCRSTCRCVSARPSTTRCWWRSTISWYFSVTSFRMRSSRPDSCGNCLCGRNTRHCL